MPNKDSSEKNNSSPDRSKSNPGIDSLEKVEQAIKQAAYAKQEPKDNFRAELLLRLKEQQRAASATTARRSINWRKFFQLKLILPIAAVGVIAALLITTMNIRPGFFTGQGQFTRLFITAAHAQDNFQVEPISGNALGIDQSTGFIIKSKQAVDAKELRGNLSFEPAVDFDFEKISDYEFKVMPKTDLADKTVYKLHITAAFMAESGAVMDKNYSFAFQVTEQFKVLHTLPANQTTNVPQDIGIEVTFSHELITVADFEKAFSIEPAVSGRFEQHRRTMVFVPSKPLSQGTIYTVTIGKDLPAASIETGWEQDYVFQFETDKDRATRWGNQPYFSYADDFVEYNPRQIIGLPVYINNSSQTDFPSVFYRFDDAAQFSQALIARQQIPWWAEYNAGNYRYDKSNLEIAGKFNLTVSQNTGFYDTYLILNQPLPAGQYLVETEVFGRTAQVLLQVTDLTVFASVTQTDTMVWVNDSSTKSPVVRAEVAVLGTEKKFTADNQGLAVFDTQTGFSLEPSEEFNNQAEYLIISGNGQTIVAPVQNNYYGELVNSEYWNYFYTDRQQYQPDDTINIWGFLKSRDGQPISEPVKFRINSGDYNYYSLPIELAAVDLALGANGSFNAQVKLAKAAPGYYFGELWVGEKIIKNIGLIVQDYVKPAYKIEVLPVKNILAAGRDAAEFNLRAMFFDGTAVPELTVNYTFGEQTGELTTDIDGRAQLKFPIDYEPCSDEYWCNYPRTVWLETYVDSEVGNISGEASVQVLGPLVEARGSFKKINEQTAEIQTAVKSIDLARLEQSADISNSYGTEPLSQARVHGRVVKIWYEKQEAGEDYDFINKVVYKKYNYIRHDDLLTEFDGLTDEQGLHQYLLALEPEVNYKVSIAVADQQGREYKFVQYLNHYLLQEDNFYNNYSLEFDNQDALDWNYGFDIGEPVAVRFVNQEVLVKAGAGSKFLYYKLHNGLLDYEVAASPEYSFDFKAEYVPNIYLRAVWFDGVNYHQVWPWWFSHGLDVRYDSDSRRLKIDVQADHERYEPGQAVKLDVQVSDQSGRPAAAAVNINLVDEAYYQISQEAADPLPVLYSNIAGGELAVYESHRYAKIHELTGGGGAEGGCFTAGTKIKTASGREINIEEVQVGQEILTFDNEQQRGLVRAVVERVFEHQVPGYIEINGRLKVTPEHRVWVNHGWQMIGAAKVGDRLLDNNGRLVIITDIKIHRQPVKVYNLQIEKYHTYFADGIYVHNDKGGAREFFPDVALFKSLETDARGRASVEFTLPDNLTSWRITTQAITTDLQAGAAVDQLPVSLPAFVDMSLPSELLTVDQPIVRLRAYGAALSGKQAVEFSLESTTLGLAAGALPCQAFKSIYQPLPALKPGIHKITAGLRAADYQDSLILPISVADSRLVSGRQAIAEVKPGLKISGSSTERTQLVFADNNRGQYYSQLLSLNWTAGDRLDQKLSRVMAQKWRGQYFNEPLAPTEDINIKNYQLPGGGAALLPFSGEDLAITVKAAAVAPEYFDQASLKNYFYQILNGRDSNQEEIIWALAGLAALNEPVLINAQNMMAAPALTPVDKLRLALACLLLADNQNAQTLYLQVLQDFGEEKAPYIRINLDGTADSSLEATSLAAVIAAGLSDERMAPLWSYVQANYGQDILTNLEQLLYLKYALPNSPAGPVSFTLLINGQKENIELNKGASVQKSVTADQLATIDFENVAGNASVVSYYQEPAAIESIKVDPALSLRREYYVNGRPAQTIKQNDLVQIRLYPKFTAAALAGDYQITDRLPGGLAIITQPYSRGLDADCGFRYPYEISGQRISFIINKNWQIWSADYCQADYFSYYARVVSPGGYTAEPALIQAFKNTASQNYSSAARLTIGHD